MAVKSKPGRPKLKKKELKKHENFFNREISWLAFNGRVLEEALDPEVPLVERLKFLAIVSSNLDEYFMVRVAGLKQLVRAGVCERGPDGLSPEETLARIARITHDMVAEQYRCLREEVLLGLEALGIRIRQVEDLTRVQRKALLDHFCANILPILTPLAVDPGHPFPHLINKSLNLAILLRSGGRGDQPDRFAVVQTPRMLSRLVPVAGRPGERHFVCLEDLISNFIDKLFPGMKPMGCFPFRVTRDSDLDLKEDEADDLLEAIKEELAKRDTGHVVRLEVGEHMTPDVIERLTDYLELTPDDVYRIEGPINLCDLLSLTELPGLEAHKDKPFTPAPIPALAGKKDIFEAIRAGDFLVHHPYETFSVVVDFVETAAEDPAVLAIKQTLYRTSGDSPIVLALQRAAENGKQVAALVELKARFDEENNIVWARRLEEAGVHVVYGLLGLKTHCKACMVVRQEPDGLRRYVHLGTGNYHPKTARLYTDLGLFTCDPDLAQDTGDLFNLLTGYSQIPVWKKLAVAPLDLYEKVIARIKWTMGAKKSGRIIAKMNSLIDPAVIRALYRASSAGVKIDLIVRGMCCLVPGLPGISENITVTSIVDRFLEHSRIFYFARDSQEEVYLSSADWMQRNLYRRVETMFPVESPPLKRRLIDEILPVYLKDNVKARVLLPDGTYVRRRTEGERFRAQTALLVRPEAPGPEARPAILPEAQAAGGDGSPFRPLTYEDALKRTQNK
ncbi:polyphosphate kinase 1 [bacterium]|nr:polyphosphate kinase 1 [bacterium]